MLSKGSKSDDDTAEYACRVATIKRRGFGFESKRHFEELRNLGSYLASTESLCFC